MELRTSINRDFEGHGVSNDLVVAPLVGVDPTALLFSEIIPGRAVDYVLDINTGTRIKGRSMALTDRIVGDSVSATPSWCQAVVDAVHPVETAQIKGKGRAKGAQEEKGEGVHFFDEAGTGQ